MKVGIEDTHDSHGSVFTIAMEAGSKKDKQVIKTLADFLDPIFDGKSAMYVYGVEISPNGCKLKLAEAAKKLAQVDYHWNQKRKDNKFVVLVLEGENEL